MSDILYKVTKSCDVRTTDGSIARLDAGLYRVHPGDNGHAFYPVGGSEPIVVAEGERLSLTKEAVLRKEET